MEIQENVFLKDFTTFHVGGLCKHMYIPESEEEVIELYRANQSAFKYCLGGGSNLLINDSTVFDNVLNLRKFNTKIVFNKDSTVYIGASVRLQKAIKVINENGFGGIEYLYSVPGLIGGAVLMNAGRGKTYNQSISDFIVSIDVLDNGVKKTIQKDDCDFEYRHSIFQEQENCVILGVLFRFERKSTNETQNERKKRIELCKAKQDNSGFNFGTVFCKADKATMEMVRLLSLKKEGIRYSKKTRNWLLNDGTGTYKDAITEIDRVKKIHRFLNKECRLEVKVWNE